MQARKLACQCTPRSRTVIPAVARHSQGNPETDGLGRGLASGQLTAGPHPGPEFRAGPLRS
eukprot:1346402-Lingulodinium_polyedra.AAC.1